MQISRFSYSYTDSHPEIDISNSFLFPEALGCAKEFFTFKRSIPLTNYLFNYIAEGEFLFNDGTDTDPFISCKKGSVIIFKPNDWFYVTPTTPNPMRIWFHINGTAIPEILKNLNLTLNQKIPMPLDENHFASNYNQLINAMTTENIGQVTLAYHSLKFLEQFNQNQNSKIESIPKELKNCFNYINENYLQEISITTLAKMSNVSESYLIKNFKKYYGKTPHQIILERRYSLAKHQLLNTDIPISEIAVSCGFGDRYHFSQSFKKRYEMTPFEYRKNLKTY